MSKFSFFFLATPPIKVKLHLRGRLLIANHLDQSLSSTNHKYWASVRFNLLHSFLEVNNCIATFTSHWKLHEFGAEKPISWAKLTHFDFSAVCFTVWSHILSTVGNAVSQIHAKSLNEREAPPPKQPPYTLHILCVRTNSNKNLAQDSQSSFKSSWTSAFGSFFFFPPNFVI